VKKKAWHPETVGFVQYINEENKPVLFVRIAVWQFAKLRVLAKSHKKITEEGRKNFL